MPRTPWDDAAIDFQTKRDRQRRSFYGRQPKPLKNVLAQLITTRGYGQKQAHEQLQAVWAAIVGEPLAGMSQACRVNGGKVEVVVANSVAHQELTFQRGRLVGELRQRLPGSRIRDIRLRVGTLRSK